MADRMDYLNEFVTVKEKLRYALMDEAFRCQESLDAGEYVRELRKREKELLDLLAAVPV